VKWYQEQIAAESPSAPRSVTPARCRRRFIEPNAPSKSPNSPSSLRDYDEAIRFYTATLGFSLLEDTDLGGGKRWVASPPRLDGHSACCFAPRRHARAG
jgi:hypothetical protein